MKAYADDLTLLSQSRDDHQSALSTVDNACRDLGLEVRPDKCVSYCFNGMKSLPRTIFSLSKGNTRNISSGPTKFLGETIGITTQLSKRAASEFLLEPSKCATLAALFHPECLNIPYLPHLHEK